MGSRPRMRSRGCRGRLAELRTPTREEGWIKRLLADNRRWHRSAAAAPVLDAAGRAPGSLLTLESTSRGQDRKCRVERTEDRPGVLPATVTVFVDGIARRAHVYDGDSQRRAGSVWGCSSFLKARRSQRLEPSGNNFCRRHTGFDLGEGLADSNLVDGSGRLGVCWKHSSWQQGQISTDPLEARPDRASREGRDRDLRGEPCRLLRGRV